MIDKPGFVPAAEVEDYLRQITPLISEMAEAIERFGEDGELERWAAEAAAKKGAAPCR